MLDGAASQGRRNFASEPMQILKISLSVLWVKDAQGSQPKTLDGDAANHRLQPDPNALHAKGYWR
jgi:hypothetical protein